MIIKSIRRGGFKEMGEYLLGTGSNADENEACTLIASSGFDGFGNVVDIMRDMYFRVADRLKGKFRVKKPFEHIILRTHADDPLSPEQAKESLKILLEKAGYASCPWVMTQHIKDGHAHYHVALLRVDDTGQLINPKMQDICRPIALELAKKFGLKVYPKMARYEESKAQLTKLWTDTATLKQGARLKAFIKAGFIPARGNGNQLVFVDRHGKPHSPHHIGAVKVAKMKREDVKYALGFDGEKIKLIPTFKAVSKAIYRKGVKPTFKRITRRFLYGARSILKNISRIRMWKPSSKPMPQLRAWTNDDLRREPNSLLRMDEQANGFPKSWPVQQARASGGRANRSAGGVDLELSRLSGVVGTLESELQRLEAADRPDPIAINNKLVELATAKEAERNRRLFLESKSRASIRPKFQPPIAL
jgi:hypothetical protein